MKWEGVLSSGGFEPAGDMGLECSLIPRKISTQTVKYLNIYFLDYCLN